MYLSSFISSINFQRLIIKDLLYRTVYTFSCLKKQPLLKEPVKNDTFENMFEFANMSQMMNVLGNEL